MQVFEKTHIGKCEIKNRIIRSATFEGMADANGYPTEEYLNTYKELSKNNIGAIITGFAYISKEGKAMHPGQAGIYSKDLVPDYKRITEEIHKNDSKIFLQIAHTGRQTRKQETNEDVLGVSSKSSMYFKGKPIKLTTDQVYTIIEQFGDAALYAKQANFDGIQLHAAHGYLIHQFILSSVNNRKDLFGIDKDIQVGTSFIDLVIDNVRKKCGEYFPILIKISGSDDYINKFSKKQFINLIKFLNTKQLAAIEVSYGTMDYALNIFRGDVPAELILKHNKMFKTKKKILKLVRKKLMLPILKIKLIPFSPMYNLQYAIIAKKHTNIPVISVGGFKEKKEIEYAIENMNIDYVSMSRPFICEPDFAVKLASNTNYSSKCTNCNYCAIMCDSNMVTKCYKGR